MPSGGDRSPTSPLLAAIKEQEGEDYYGGDEGRCDWNRTLPSHPPVYLPISRAALRIRTGKIREMRRRRNEEVTFTKE